MKIGPILKVIGTAGGVGLASKLGGGGVGALSPIAALLARKKAKKNKLPGAPVDPLAPLPDPAMDASRALKRKNASAGLMSYGASMMH